VVVGTRTQRAIWRYLVDEGERPAAHPLFATRTGRHIRREALRHLLTRIGTRAGVVNVHPHRCRHTFAITFLRNGGNLLTLQELLGHESLDMVKRYARLAERDIDAARSASPINGWRV
jgi:integrase/recombinase XerD